MQALRSVAVLDHPKVPATGEVAAEIAEFLAGLKISVARATTWDTAAAEAIIPNVDLVIVLGGDGSLLRAARMAAPHGKLVTSVNMGRLGFLSEMEPDTWRDVLPRMMAGEYWVEERLMLRTEARRWEKTLAVRDALNDVVIGRGTLARVVRLQVKLDGTPFTTYACDGLIVASPTGSTAYALAAGGPILPPTLHNMILVPIAPHLSLDQPIVLAPTSVIEARISTDHQAILTVDGQNEITLKSDDIVRVSASPLVARLARAQSQDYFFKSLMSRINGG
ncbi:MAG: NAD(+)/NADH kinase [Thermoflexales bacterium]|nr:NAD(+)/NADH kinase [Thermoflexales bacterium]